MDLGAVTVVGMTIVIVIVIVHVITIIIVIDSSSSSSECHTWFNEAWVWAQALHAFVLKVS